ncbi:MAG: UDP-N-acetylglucosamine pyrophosphorylase [Lachnospiraceae bacterium]|nr:UDP-N-acetylglucosamine pyrophosphorylase [Lachnospiraceae bacterium]
MSNVTEINIKNMYSLEHTAAKEYLEKLTYPWEALPHIKDYILEIGKGLSCEEYNQISENVWIHKTAKVFDSAYIAGPTIIGPDTEVRQCAFIRGNALVGAGCVIGNSTELKNVIIFDNVQVPHYNYVGDSVLGYKSHMGAGSITSNVKSDKTLVHVKGKSYDGQEFDLETGLKKFGAMLGDNVEVGCNSVLNPGTVVGSNSNIYPLSPVRGYVPSNSIYKTGGVIANKE